MEKEFYELLEEQGMELDHNEVRVEFNERSIFMEDEDQENYPVIGQEGITFYGVYEAVEFVEKNNLTE